MMTRKRKNAAPPSSVMTLRIAEDALNDLNDIAHALGESCNHMVYKWLLNDLEQFKKEKPEVINLVETMRNLRARNFSNEDLSEKKRIGSHR